MRPADPPGAASRYAPEAVVPLSFHLVFGTGKNGNMVRPGLAATLEVYRAVAAN